MGRRIAAMIVFSVVVAGAAGAAGFLIERSHVRTINQIRAARGTQAVAQRQFRAGLEQGKKEGAQTGYQEGTKRLSQISDDAWNAGYDAALAGFDGPGSWYIVRLINGSGGIPLKIGRRVKMTTTQSYDLCAFGNQICSSTTTASRGNGGGPSATPAVPLPTIPAPNLPTPNVPIPTPTYPVPCADGTISPSGGHQGACSHHGGEL